MAGKQEPDEEMYLLTDGPPKLSEIISNLGIVCVNSSTFLWRVLNQFGITPENRAGVFTPVDVYRVMQEIFAPSGLRSSNPEYTEKFNAVLSQGNLGLVISADSYGEKEAKVLADAINEAAPGFDWGELFAHVEKISTPQMGKKAGKFFGFFLKTAFEENLSRFPTQHLYTKWSDRGFQFHTIKTIIEDAPELIINTSEDHRPVIQPKVMSSIPLHVANSLRNSPFNSLDLIEALIVFSQDSLYPEVKELMEQGIRQRPELILLGLTESEIPWNALYRELAPGLVLLFVRGHPSSSYVLPILWQTNKTLVTTGLMHLYSKSTAYMPRILEVSQEIKALSELLDMRSCTFGINLALAASSANLLDVNKWLQTRLSAEGRDFLASCISFLEEELSHELEKEQPGVKIQAVPKDVQATMPMATSQMTGVNNHEKTGNKYTHVLPENSNNSPLLTSAIISKLLNFLISNCSLMPPEIHSSFKSFNLKLVTAYPEFTNMVSSLLPEEKSEPASSDSGTSINDSEITSKSISYFEELYRGDLSLKQVVELFQNLYSSTSKAEKVTYECMVRYLLNEYKFLDCYPDKQLLTTAALYGYLINLQLLDPHTLPVALKHVLDALKHRSDSPHFRFGFCALSLFDQKLPEWRQYSEQLLHISSLQQFAPDLILFIKNFLQSSENKRDLSPKDQTIDRRPDAKDVRAIYPSSATKTSPDATLPDSTVSRKPGSSKPKTPTPEDRKDQTIQSPLPENVHNAVLFIINNLSSTNVVEKAEQIKKYLDDQTKAWLSYYIVSNRVCFEPNFSDLYVSFISHINDKKLDGYIITSTYKVIYDIIGVNKVEYTFQERHALKNLGIWLGHISLTKNKPIKHKHLSFKDLLITSYNIKTLPAIIPFVCKVFERATQDSVFFPPNPWTMSVLKMLAELYYYSQMRTNLKLQIDILFKNLNLEISEIERSDIFRALQKKKDTEAVAICSRAVERPLLQTSDDVCHTAQQNLSGGNEPLQPIDNVVFNTGRDYGMPYSRKKSLNTSSGSPIEEKPWNTQYGVSSRGTSASGMKSIDNPYFLKRIVQMGVESAIREVRQLAFSFLVMVLHNLNPCI